MDIHTARALHMSLIFYSAMLASDAAGKLETSGEGLGG